MTGAAGVGREWRAERRCLILRGWAEEEMRQSRWGMRQLGIWGAAGKEELQK